MTVADVASRTGDAARGEAASWAAARHAIGAAHRQAPTSVPTSTDIDKKFDRAGLIEAIVNPSAAIAFGFGAELFVTRRSEPIIGFLQSEGATISIRDGYGRTRTIAADDLAARVPLKSSLMPDPLLARADRPGRRRYRRLSDGVR